MRRVTMYLAVLLFLTILCGGCSRFTVASSHDLSANFQGLKTYAWKPGPQPSIGDPRVDDKVIDAAVRGSVDRELAAKGFTKASAGDVDFLLTYTAGTTFESSTVAITRSTTQQVGGWTPWAYPDTSSIERGTVVLMVFDPTAKLIWRGVAAGMFDRAADPQQRHERIADAIHKLLKQFPPP